VTGYAVFVTRSAWDEIKAAPGFVRQRIRRAIDALETDPRQPDSRQLDLAEVGLEISDGQEVWRLRLDKWRILYLVSEPEHLVDVLAVRRRPPYDYGDLEQLLSERD
jgi:mRNA interferase RelE/StbE